MTALKQIVDTTSDDIGFKASVDTGFRDRFHVAAVAATRDVFENEILPAAKAGSPVRSGKNRDSINVSFRDRADWSWISAWLYTQSGYGWLIEHGTSSSSFRFITKKAKNRRGSNAPLDRTPPRPYIYPAILRFVRTIPERARQIFEQSSQ